MLDLRTDETGLASRRDALERALDLLPVPTYIKGQDGAILFVNRALMGGHPPQGLVDRVAGVGTDGDRPGRVHAHQGAVQGPRSLLELPDQVLGGRFAPAGQLGGVPDSPGRYEGDGLHPLCLPR